MAADKRSKRERQQGAADGTRVEGRDSGGGSCLGGDDGGEANALSWRRAASPGKRHLGVLPRGALRVLQDIAIGSVERPSEIRARPYRVVSSARHEPLFVSRRVASSARASERRTKRTVFQFSRFLRDSEYFDTLAAADSLREDAAREES